MSGLTHWKKLRNPDYLGSWDFDENEVKTLTISGAKQETVTGTDGKRDECMVLYFRDQGVKPMIVNATNAKMIQKHAGTPYIEKWPGVKISIHTEKVKAFGDIHDALRVMKKTQQSTTPSPAATPPPTCSDCGAVVQGSGSKSPEYVIQYTAKKYGRPLCGACASKEAEKAKPAEEAAPPAEAAAPVETETPPDFIDGEVEFLD